mgnify:CR=1 FL=1
MIGEPIFNYNEHRGTTTCTISDGQNTFIGTARCHPNDRDCMSEYTGCEIAERRCKIKILQHIKNNQIIPQIQAYEHLISTMLNSKQLNPQSYEFKRIKAEYDNLLNQYTAIKNKIKYSQSKLREYIAEYDVYCDADASSKKDAKKDSAYEMLLYVLGYEEEENE